MCITPRPPHSCCYSLPFGPLHPYYMWGTLNWMPRGLLWFVRMGKYSQVCWVTSPALGLPFNLVAAVSDQERARRVCMLKTGCIGWLAQTLAQFPGLAMPFPAWFRSYPWSCSQGCGSRAPEWAQVRDVVCTPAAACVSWGQCCQLTQEGPPLCSLLVMPAEDSQPPPGNKYEWPYFTADKCRHFKYLPNTVLPTYDRMWIFGSF